MTREAQGSFLKPIDASGGDIVESSERTKPLFDKATLKSKDLLDTYIAQIALRDHWQKERAESRRFVAKHLSPDEMDGFESSAHAIAEARKAILRVKSQEGDIATTEIQGLVSDYRTFALERLKTVGIGVGESDNGPYLDSLGIYVNSSINMHLFETFYGPHHSSSQLKELLAETGDIPQVPVGEAPSV